MPRSISRLRRLSRPASGGFSLLELLLATAVFMIIVLIVLSLTTNTLSLTKLSTQRIGTDAGSRQILDRISADFAKAVIRNDTPPLFLKTANGNDELRFAIETDGYEGDRGVSVVSYRVNDGKLERGVAGKYWTGNQLVFGGTSTPSALTDAQYETISNQVFRFEMSFLMANGGIKSSPGNTWEDVRAVIIAIALVDENARKKFPVSLSALTALFPDYEESSSLEDTANIIQQWDAVTDAPGFYQGDVSLPGAVRAGIRIDQRYFPIRR